MYVILILLLAIHEGASQQTCPVGGSTSSCGYLKSGSVSGGFQSPCSCNPNFCCSQYGNCGPEPTVPGTDAKSAYCGSGCQSQYGNCDPGNSCPCKVYFEYIGTGKTCGSSNCPAPDRVNTPSIINQIPIPKSGAPLYFLVFLLSDQIGSNIGSGISSGQFGPVGLFASGTKEAPFWDATQIGYLASRGKVMASIAGDTSITKWQGVADVTSYISTATASLRSYRSKFGLAGFDINYEETINGAQQQQWIDAWCQIVYNLKQDGALITFAPYTATISAYKKLQDCLFQKRANIDFIIYQLYSVPTADATELTKALQDQQKTFAPTKIIAGIGNGQLNSNPNFVSQVIKPMLDQDVITGVSVFDADTSSASSPAFKLESAVWAT